MNENYQPVMIKTLLESPNYESTRDQIISKLKEVNRNEDRDYGQIFWDVINEVLKRKPNLIRKYDKQQKTLSLIVDEKLSDKQKSTLIELCDEQIAKVNQSTIDPIKFQELHEEFLEDMKNEAKEMSVEPPNDEFTNFQHPYFLAEEVKYKREAVEKAQKALSLEKWDEWKSEPTKIFDAVKNACSKDVHKNLISYQYLANFGGKPSILFPLNEELTNNLGIQFYDFFKGSADFPTRLDNLIQFLRDNKISPASQVLAYLSFILDPEQYIPIRETEFKKLAVYYKCYRTSTPRFSWQSYSVFLDMLEDVKSLLAQQYDRPDNIEAHSYLWCASSLLSKTESKKYWLIIPGDDSDKKSEFISENKITVGYHNIDLSKFYDGKPYVEKGNYKNKKSLEEIKIIIKKRLEAKSDNEPVDHRQISWHEIWLHWFAGIAKNDTVILCSGSKTIFAIGKITGEYEYLKERASGHVHRREVEWYDTNERDVPQQYRYGGQGAIRKLPYDSPLRKWLFGTETHERITAPETNSKKYQKYIDVLEYKQNMILYGPPGTGKTYHAKNIAEELIKKTTKRKLTWLKAVLKIFRKVNGKPLHYTEILKLIDKEWLVDYTTKTPEFSMLREITEDIRINKEKSLFEKVKKGTYKIRPEEQTELEKELGEEPGDEESIDQFKKMITFHQSFSYEEFMEGIKANLTENKKAVTYDVEDGIFKEFCKKARDDPEDRNYVLIIDEINRGNISKIFGEIITIMEKDKRGEDVDLAYSKTSFNVPENLYIIGTMNTADRSLTQIDAALKRRFSMMEIMPDSSVLGDQEVKGIHLGKLLKKINGRIRTHGERDNQIGHSYFMVKDENSGKTEPMTKITDLQLAFSTDILPLLRDYFYDNTDVLYSEILKNEFLESDTENLKEEWQKDSGIFVDTLKKAFDV